MCLMDRMVGLKGRQLKGWQIGQAEMGRWEMTVIVLEGAPC